MDFWNNELMPLTAQILTMYSYVTSYKGYEVGKTSVKGGHRLQRMSSDRR